mmetsp:Transcript_19610/g.23237  ORF Transcript_19610/g.23237 Transcript_19610/m.23237 type:complete len:150 (-) Transcript_19610:26-475(-)
MFARLTVFAAFCAAVALSTHTTSLSSGRLGDEGENWGGIVSCADKANCTATLSKQDSISWFFVPRDASIRVHVEGQNTVTIGDHLANYFSAGDGCCPSTIDNSCTSKYGYLQYNGKCSQSSNLWIAIYNNFESIGVTILTGDGTGVGPE